MLAPGDEPQLRADARYRSRRLRADLTAFQTDVDDNIAKQSLILPPGAVGLVLAGEPITRQLASGVVFVAVSTSPVLVRTNFDEARIRGLEATLDAELGASFSLGRDVHLAPRRGPRDRAPAEHRGRDARPRGLAPAALRPAGGRRFWVEPYLHAAARQERLSTLDLGDRRTGASRSRSSIASFFTNGARARGLVSSGPDGVAGNADDVLLPTGETLAEVQARVLPGRDGGAALRRRSPATSSSASAAPSGFASRHEILVDLENLGDENYRGISWGLDAPGRGVYVRYSLRF